MIQKVTPGTPVTVAKINELIDAVNLQDIRVAAPLQKFGTGGHTLLSLAQQGFMGKITAATAHSPGNSWIYTVAEVQKAPNGQWSSVSSGGRSVSAYEVNNATVAVNTYVWVEPDGNGDWRFEYDTTGAGLVTLSASVYPFSSTTLVQNSGTTVVFDTFNWNDASDGSSSPITISGGGLQVPAGHYIFGANIIYAATGTSTDYSECSLWATGPGEFAIDKRHAFSTGNMYHNIVGDIKFTVSETVTVVIYQTMSNTATVGSTFGSLLCSLWCEKVG